MQKVMKRGITCLMGIVALFPLITSCDYLTHYIVVENESKKPVEISYRIIDKADNDREISSGTASFDPGQIDKHIDVSSSDLLTYTIPIESCRYVEISIPGKGEIHYGQIPVSIKVLDSSDSRCQGGSEKQEDKLRK